MIQTMIRICRALLFYLSHNQETAYQPFSSTTLADQSAEENSSKKITNTAKLLLWTHCLLRALLRKTWGDQASALLQLVLLTEFCLTHTLSFFHII